MSKRISFASPFTVLLAIVAGCATSGSLESLRADHNQAYTEAVRKQAEVDAATKAAAEAEGKKTAAVKALAGGLVKAAEDDFKVSEAAKERAKAKRNEACELDPTLPECTVHQPAAPAATPPQATPAAPQAATASQPEASKAQAVEVAQEAEPEPEPDLIAIEIPKAEEAPAKVDIPHVYVRIESKGDKRQAAYINNPPKGWEVVYKHTGENLVLALTIDGKEKYTVKSAKLPVGTCWKLFKDGTVTDGCPPAK